LTITYFTLLLGIAIYAGRIDEIKEAWIRPHWSHLKSGKIEYLKLGVPSAFLVAFEWMASECLVLMAGYLG
jgi:hypothetical protein